jgi:hypothetical protein
MLLHTPSDMLRVSIVGVMVKNAMGGGVSSREKSLPALPWEKSAAFGAPLHEPRAVLDESRATALAARSLPHNALTKQHGCYKEGRRQRDRPRNHLRPWRHRCISCRQASDTPHHGNRHRSLFDDDCASPGATTCILGIAGPHNHLVVLERTCFCEW